MNYSIGVMLTITLFTSACASTFLVSKDGKGYYLGNESNAAFKMFCESGDLARILANTQLSQEMKDDLFRYNCGIERSREKIKQIYTSMTPEQRKNLRVAFQQNGYDINYLPC